MAKIDVKSAFRCIAVHPHDRHLLGFKWNGHYYADLCLPFGLKSSPALWDVYASLANWICNLNGVQNLRHYVDDYITVGTAGSNQCAIAVQTILKVFKALGIPVNTDKFALEGTPTTTIKFLGINIDSVKQIITLDADRITEIKATLQQWRKKSHCTVTELQSLIGTLAFASHVVQTGRTFLRRLIDTVCTGRNHVTRIHLDSEFQKDITWWSTFIDHWNGRSMFYDEAWTDSDTLQLSTDATHIGYGASFGREWFYGKWTDSQLEDAYRSKRVSVPYLELLVLVMAAATWGSKWNGKRIHFLCDCFPVVQSLNHGASRERGLMSLVRTLHYIAYLHSFTFRVTHIRSADNVVADRLSRVQMEADIQNLLSSNPNFNRLPTQSLPIPIHDW